MLRIRLSKLLITGVNVAFALAIFVLQSSTGYHSSVFAVYPIGFWVLIIVLLNAVIGLSFISSERTTVYAAALATFVLLSIGAKTGAGVYGPDSYIKAMKVRQILRVGRVEIDLYNGLKYWLQ